MYRFTLTLPTQYNDGGTVGPELRGYFEARLLGTFGGFTATESLGAWIGHGRVYSEPVTVYTLDSDTGDEYPLLLDIAEYAAFELKQESVYVTRTDADGSQSREFVSARPVVS